MARLLKTTLKASALFILFTVATVSLFVGYQFTPWGELSSAKETVAAWCQLDDYPSTFTAFQHTTTGSIFTREIELEFDGPPSDIRNWLKGSKGVGPDKLGEAGTAYTLKPDLDGATYGEIWVDEQIGRVSIHTFWS